MQNVNEQPLRRWFGKQMLDKKNKSNVLQKLISFRFDCINKYYTRSQIEMCSNILDSISNIAASYWLQIF